MKVIMSILSVVLVVLLAVPVALVVAIALGPVILGIICGVGFGLLVFALANLVTGFRFVGPSLDVAGLRHRHFGGHA